VNKDLLDADCVIQHLCNKNIISFIEWRSQHPNDQNYNVYFNPISDKAGDIGLNIIKRSGMSRKRVNLPY
jgi:hypothetical protein